MRIHIQHYIVLIGVLFLTGNVLCAQTYTFPEYTSYQLENGLTINLMEQKEVPLISISALIPAGAVNDDTKPGIAYLTSTALKHGTANYSKEDIDNTLDYLGADINTYAGKEYAGLDAGFISKDLEKVMPILAEIMTQPSFDAEELQKEKDRHLAGLERKKEQPRAVIGQFFDQLIYSDHPYGTITDGNLNSVQSISREDVQEFFNDNYHPSKAVISIVGDFDMEAMKESVKNYFGSWKGEETESTSVESLPELPESNQVLLVNKDDATETTFYIGGRGISRNNPDYLGIMVVNTFFGGRFTSMLNDELRVNSGLTYGARSRFDTMKEGGSFYISTFTATETTEAAMDKAIEVLQKLHDQGISEQDLTSARNYVKGQFPPRFETSGQLAGLLSEMFWYGFDESFINNFNTNVDQMTTDKVKEIISTYFPKDHLKIVMVGKASEVEEIAAKYGEVSKVEIESIIQ